MIPKFLRSRDYPNPTKRHWKCKLGFHDWGLYYIGPYGSIIKWHGHIQDCQREHCTRRLFHFHPPEGEIRYRKDDRS